MFGKDRNADSVDRPEGWSAVPGFFKGLIIFQSFTTVFLGYWIYQEFRNNVYLQLYLRNFDINSNVVTILLLGALMLVMASVYRMRRSAVELDDLLVSQVQQLNELDADSLDFEEHLLKRLRQRNREYEIVQR